MGESVGIVSKGLNCSPSLAPSAPFICTISSIPSSPLKRPVALLRTRGGHVTLVTSIDIGCHFLTRPRREITTYVDSEHLVTRWICWKITTYDDGGGNRGRCHKKMSKRCRGRAMSQSGHAGTPDVPTSARHPSAVWEGGDVK